MTEQATQSSECEAMGAITDAHEAFKPFVGVFAAEVKLWMGSGDPHLSTGVMTNTLELGGRFLHQNYKGDPGDGAFPDFEGRGYWGFNTATGKYEGLWIDTASTCMQTDAGDVDDSGKVWTMIGEVPNPQTGQTMRKKSVITLVDNNHHSVEMFFETPEGEVKGMEIQYTRET